jgi:hypothetical protein
VVPPPQIGWYVFVSVNVFGGTGGQEAKEVVVKMMDFVNVIGAHAGGDEEELRLELDPRTGLPGVELDRAAEENEGAAELLD